MKNQFPLAIGFPKGTTIVELLVVIVLFAVLLPSALGLYISARKIGGQAYVQGQAASTLGETVDILRQLRAQGFDLLNNGEFYLIRNPGTGLWLVKDELPNLDTFERHVAIENARRHTGTHQLYLDGDTGTSYEDPDTKKITIQILWSPDYLPLDLMSQTLYLTDWQKTILYN